MENTNIWKLQILNKRMKTSQIVPKAVLALYVNLMFVNLNQRKRIYIYVTQKSKDY